MKVEGFGRVWWVGSGVVAIMRNYKIANGIIYKDSDDWIRIDFRNSQNTKSSFPVWDTSRLLTGVSPDCSLLSSFSSPPSLFTWKSVLLEFISLFWIPDSLISQPSPLLCIFGKQRSRLRSATPVTLLRSMLQLKPSDPQVWTLETQPASKLSLPLQSKHHQIST